jgi:hypothetical protein
MTPGINKNGGNLDALSPEILEKLAFEEFGQLLVLLLRR